MRLDSSIILQPNRMNSVATFACWVFVSSAFSRTFVINGCRPKCKAHTLANKRLFAVWVPVVAAQWRGSNHETENQKQQTGSLTPQTHNTTNRIHFTTENWEWVKTGEWNNPILYVSKGPFYRERFLRKLKSSYFYVVWDVLCSDGFTWEQIFLIQVYHSKKSFTSAALNQLSDWCVSCLSLSLSPASSVCL